MKRAAIFLALVLLTIFVLLIADSFAQEKPGQASQQIEKTVSERVVSEETESAQVSLDFEDADIRDVIEIITMASGMNMVIGEDVQAKVTISLKDMPWERALDVILRTYNFTYKKEESLIRIMTFAKVKQEEKDIPLIIKVIALNFPKAEEMKGTLEDSLSDRGKIKFDKRTNSMIVTDIPTRVEKIEKVIKKLDTRTPQVLIEAMLVDVKLTEDDELGINWKIFSTHGLPDREDEADYIEQPSAMSTLSGTTIKSVWTQRLGEYWVEGLIQAWTRDAKANILASPKILTLNNETAKIEIKTQVPYTKHTVSTEGGAIESTQFKDVPTILEVTPQITKQGFVSMQLTAQQDVLEGIVGGEPQIGSRNAKTTVLVKDGETIVIGGLRKAEDTVTITKVPFLGDIPFIGNLFRKKDVQKVNTELVMFVTPHIIVHPELTDEEIDRYEMLDDAREDFLKIQEKERKKRLKRRKRQAKLLKPEVTEEIALPESERIEEIEIPPLSAAKEEKIEQESELDKGYIYSW